VQCDPIEKKPFFHAHPGALAYSFGMLGCDLHCAYCQNWVTSQALRDPNAVSPPLGADPELLVKDALAQGAKFVVSTYNEPLITSEWAVEVFRHARQAGLLTAFVSNGNGTPQVLEYLHPWIDLYKVDLKSFDDHHYRQLGGRLQPILDTIRSLHKMGVWLEIVTLLIPGFNDGDDELRKLTTFLADVSPDIPWHVTAFHQDYKMTSPADTSPDDLLRAAAIGREAGLRYIYAGNLPGRVQGLEDTRCPQCGELLIERYGYSVREYKLTADGDCPACHKQIPGRWSEKFEGQIAAAPFLPRRQAQLVRILSQP
jgi:pyruvate formate lyase activating enzyme